MRSWNEFVADLADAVGGIFMLAFLSLLATALVALAWYFWPRWSPTRWRWPWRRQVERTKREKQKWRLGRLKWRLRWRWRKRKKDPTVRSIDDLAPDELPDLPAAELALTADQLAAAGRFAEAVRERLRAIVVELIEHEVLPHSPGWTVTELARAASYARPALTDPLQRAVTIFSEIWYGLRPALGADDEGMRSAAVEVRRDLASPTAAGSTAPASGVAR